MFESCILKTCFLPRGLLLQPTGAVWTILVEDHPGIIPMKFGQNPMLGRYLHNVIGHKSCNMLSILSKQCQRNCKILWQCVFGQRSKIQQQNKKSNLKTLAGAWNWTWELSHSKRMRYICITESTESNDWSRAITVSTQ